MKVAIVQWIDHYATVTNGKSDLFRESLLLECATHGIAEPDFCDAFATAVAEAFVAGKLDPERASFAMDDLFWAAECSLGGFALKVLDALEYAESTTRDVQELLSSKGSDPEYREGRDDR